MGESKQVLTALIRVDRPMPCLDALTIPKRRQISSIALKKSPPRLEILSPGGRESLGLAEDMMLSLAPNP